MASLNTSPVSVDPSIVFGTGNGGGTGGGGIPTPGFGGDPDGTLYKDANGTRWNKKGQSWNAQTEQWVDGKNGPWSLPAGSTDPLPPALYGADGTVTNFANVAAETGAGGGLTYADILRYVLPTAGGVIGGIIQANAAGSASAAQQKYLEEALAYAKEKDAYDRTRQAGLDTQERERYGGYQGRIAPFIASGTSANARMASLLGLSPTAAPSSDSYSGRTSTGVVGSAGPATGGAPARGVTTQPMPRDAGVLMVGPDGSQRRVPPDRVDEAKRLGAQLVGAA